MDGFRDLVSAFVDIVKEIVIGNDRTAIARLAHLLVFVWLLLEASFVIGALNAAAQSLVTQPVPAAPARPSVSEGRIALTINAPATVVVGRGVDGHLRIRVDPAPASASGTANAAVTPAALPPSNARALKGGC